eukprot:13694403-Alexandrium_andersonii.AAC.1
MGHEVPHAGRQRRGGRKRAPRRHQGHQGQDALLAGPRDGPRAARGHAVLPPAPQPAHPPQPQGLAGRWQLAQR